MKRKSLLLAVLAMMTSMSCNKGMGTGSVHVPSDGEIYFGVKGGVSVSKSVRECTESVLQSDGFRVAVIIDDNGTLMFDDEVVYDDDIYTVPGKTYFYPASSSISAYGVHPKTETIEFAGEDVFIHYTQDSTEDLIVAQASGVRKRNEAIDMAFEHALSQISFKVKGEDRNANYKLKRIDMIAPCAGDYHFSPNNGWEDLGDNTYYNVFTDAGAAVSTNEYQSFGEAMTFIPGTAALRVTWECYNKSNGSNDGEYDQIVPVSLCQGERSVLNILLPNDVTSNIRISISIAPWSRRSEELEVTKTAFPSVQHTNR